MSRVERQEQFTYLMKQVEDEIQRLGRISDDVWGVSTTPLLFTNAHLKSRRTLGFARSSCKREHYPLSIHIHVGSLMRYAERYIKRVVRHEYAHIVVFMLEDKHNVRYSSHGKKFCDICESFGIYGGSEIDMNCRIGNELYYRSHEAV